MDTATPTPDTPAAAPASDAPAAAPRVLRELAQLPGPRAWPVVGNLLQLDAPRFHLQVEQWCRQYGPYFRLQMGPRPVLVVADHEVVATVLRDRPDGFRRTRLLEIIGAEMGLLPGVFGANGETWKRQRRMVMAGFDPAHVKGYFPSMCRVSQRLAGRWQKAAAGAQAIDLQADLMRYTVDTIAGLAFGVEVNTLESDADVIQRHLDKIFPALYRRMMSPLPVWRWWRSAADRELERSVAAVRAAVDEFIAKARARIAARPDLREHPENLLEAMIVAAEREGGGISDLEVAGNVLTMLLAGEDTTANTIAWMIHLLWLNPESLARAIAEVRQGVADPLHPTLEEMAGLDFIEACAHETMRLKPVAPQLPLEALRETVVGDVRVPVGGVVISMLRRDSVSERFVPQAARFMPERWLSEGGPGSQANAAKRISMPFGAGPRICPGRYLALLEMKMAMTVLLGCFEVKAVDTPDGQPAAEKLSFTMTPVGLSMRLAARAAGCAAQRSPARAAGALTGRAIARPSPLGHPLSMALTLALFAITNLVLGTGAFVVAGLLAPMAADLGVGIAAAGQAMTVYALAAAVVAPLLVVLTGHWPRRRAVALALLLSVAGALVSGLAGSLPVLLLGRGLTGAGIVFAALAAAIAVALAPAERSARALSLVYLGVSLSFVIGLPVGTWLASVSSWRLPLLVIAAAAAVLLGLLMLRLPASLRTPATGWRGLGALLRRRDVLAALALTPLIGAAIFCTFSYIGPVLQALGPMSPGQVSATLSTVGVAGLLGTVAGGVLADRLGVPGALTLLVAVFLLSMIAVPFTAGVPALLLPVLAAWGASGFGLMPVQQARLAALSPDDTPVLMSLNSALLNIGTATGAAVGAVATGWIDLARLAWVGVPFMLLGLAFLRR